MKGCGIATVTLAPSLQKLDQIFRDSWGLVCEQYGQAWETHLEKASKGSLATYPEGFWSERDVQVKLSCHLMARLASFGDLIVYNDVYLGERTFAGSLVLHKMILKLKKVAPKFAPDVVVGDRNVEPFEVFCELKYGRGFTQQSPKLTDSYRKAFKEYKLNANLLGHALSIGICKLAYLCIIDDRILDLESDIDEYKRGVAAVKPPGIAPQILIHGVTHQQKREWLPESD
jgi:hypothetical protein